MHIRFFLLPVLATLVTAQVSGLPAPRSFPFPGARVLFSNKELLTRYRRLRKISSPGFPEEIPPNFCLVTKGDRLWALQLSSLPSPWPTQVNVSPARSQPLPHPACILDLNHLASLLSRLLQEVAAVSPCLCSSRHICPHWPCSAHKNEYRVTLAS